MSSCEIYVVRPNGNVEHYANARNAFGGAMHIWMTLAEKYKIQISFMDFQPLWDKTNEMEERDRWVIASTYDRVIVMREWMPTLIEHLASFIEEYPTNTLKMVWASLQDVILDDEGIGVCFNQTSVNADAWQGLPVSDDEDAERVPYNIYKQSDHWFLSPEQFDG
jgi:hypothetical protein